VRIGIVAPYSFDLPGGVRAHVQDLAEALIAMGHHVSVLAPADDEGGLAPYVVAAPGRTLPVPYNGSVARIAFGPMSVARVRRWLREGRFDVLHVHEPTVPSLSMLALLAARGPIVATFHTAKPRSRMLGAAQGMLQPMLEKVHGRIAVSAAARKLQVRHMDGGAVEIPNGVAVARFADAEPLPGWPGEGGAIGFLGRFDEPRKGFPVLLAAFRLLAEDRPGLRLLVAGPGEAVDVLADLPPDVRHRVVMLGRVTELDKARMLRSVDVYAAPNLGGESFGIILTEAMAAGTPIVASDLDAFRAVLDDGHTGVLFPTGDEAAMARALAALLDDPPRQAELRARARQAVKAYDWSRVAAAVYAVYETVVADVPGVVDTDDSVPVETLSLGREPPPAGASLASPPWRSSSRWWPPSWPSRPT
jgi:phosphatidylinositol alpha-mannosyltransferase